MGLNSGLGGLFVLCADVLSEKISFEADRTRILVLTFKVTQLAYLR